MSDNEIINQCEELCDKKYLLDSNYDLDKELFKKRISDLTKEKIHTLKNVDQAKRKSTLSSIYKSYFINELFKKKKL